MPWFRRGPTDAPPKGPDPLLGRGFAQYVTEDEAQCLRDQEALERGTIPEGAKRRVERTVKGDMPWMSTLSVHELFLGELLRIEPVVQVAGSCYYHASTDSRNRVYLDGNLDAANLVRAYYQAKDISLERLREEARDAGAHAVIDAKYHFKREETLVHFSVVGTAVRFKGLRQPRHALVSALSADDFYRLWQRGWMPMNMALGYHWHCMPVGYRTRSSTYSWYNQEVTTVTNKLMETRRHAMERMRQDAAQAGRADGLVGVSVESKIEETEILFSRGAGWDSGVTIDGTFFPYEPSGTVEIPAFNTEFFATGTAVARLSQSPVKADEVQAVLETRG